MQKSVIIVAGGSGKRMGTTIPKQFLLLKSKPVLMHTIEQFYNYDFAIEIIVVLPQAQIAYWNKLCKEHHFKIEHTIVEGGSERFYSVKNGIEKLLNSGTVAIHDGVRPLVSIDTIKRTFTKAEKTGAAIPVMPVIESLRKIDGLNSFAVNRSQYVTVQTPQCFNIELIKKAYLQNFSSDFTDDASVVEKMGIKVALVDGNVENIKITSPLDLMLAELLLNSNNAL
ncbi:MAG: 2-C-methyl-D-erythritol 4-phosphate cytidylyltransferase [Bacteroidia bacterium]